MKIHLYCLKGPYPEFYCGKAKELPRRIKEHQTGKGSKHTKGWKSFEVIRTVVLEVQNDHEACMAEASFTRQMRDELKGMIVFGPGDHRMHGSYAKNRKSPGATFNF